MNADSFRILGCVLGLACALCLWRSPRAEASDALRVLVRVAAAADRALLPRVRGQLSDVNVQLFAVDTAALEATFAEQVQAAHALAEQRGADVVLWFASANEGLLVHVATPGNDRILTRRLVDADAADGDRTASSLLEAAALAVRSAVTALAAGGGIGVSTAEALAAEEAREPVAQRAAAPPTAARSEPEPEPARAVPPPPSAADSSEPDGDEPEGQSLSPLTARVLLGLQGVIDGQSSLGQHGLYARAGIGWGAFCLQVYGTASLPTRVDDAYFTLHLARHSAGAAISARTQVTRDASVWLGAHAGAVLLSRSSAAKSPNVLAAPSSLTAAFACGPELGLDWMFGRYGLGVSLALDVLPAAPRFESAGSSPLGIGDSHRLWFVEPRLGLGVEAALP